MRTGLCIVVKRADTQSTWPLINHPRGEFFEKNRHIPLWQAVRASTAAPTYFQPHSIDLGDETGAFVDGGVSMANNPALLALQVATLSGFPFRWPTGQDNLLLVSIGTGDWSRALPVERVMDARIWNWATQIPTMLLGDASKQVESILQWVGHSPTARILDQEVGDLASDQLGPTAALTYLRYNVTLDPASMHTIGMHDLAVGADDLRDMAECRQPTRPPRRRTSRRRAQRQARTLSGRIRPDHLSTQTRGSHPGKRSGRCRAPRHEINGNVRQPSGRHIGARSH